MKTILLYILFFLFSIQGFSQKIHFTDPGNFWKVREVYTLGSNTPEDFYFDFWYTTDTVIGSTIYKRIICSDSLSRGYVREDTTLGIVYYYDIAGAFEDILYYYSLAPGDSLTYYISSTDIVDRKSTYIDSVLINGMYYKKYILNCSNCSQYAFSRSYDMIDGIGTLSGPIYPLSTGECQSGASTYDYTLVCFSQNGISPNFNTTKYSCAGSGTFNNSNTCFPDAIQNSIMSENSITISPNPTKNNINVANIKYSDNIRVEVLNILGQKLYAETLLKRQNKLSINIEQWNCGIYFLVLENEQSEREVRKVVKE